MISAKWLRLGTVLVAGAGMCALAPAASAAAATSAVVRPAITCSTFGIDEGSLQIGGEVICSGTSSQYRVKEKCTDELRGSSETEYGPYVSENNVSAKTCPDEGGTQWLASNITYQVK
jgi:hypothetical protein